MTVPFILLGLAIVAIIVFELRRGRRKPPEPAEKPEDPGNGKGKAAAQAPAPSSPLTSLRAAR